MGLWARASLGELLARGRGHLYAMVISMSTFAVLVVMLLLPS